MATRLSTRVERLWDRATAHISRHPRKYTVAGFVFIFLPQWLPAFTEGMKSLYALVSGFGLSVGSGVGRSLLSPGIG